VREHALLLGRAGFGLFLHLNSELCLLGFAHAELLLFTARTLCSQTGLLLGLQSRFVLDAPLQSVGFRTLSRVFGSPQLRFLFSGHTCRLNGMQLQELVRE
jgi:hypothetical protein